MCIKTSADDIWLNTNNVNMDRVIVTDETHLHCKSALHSYLLHYVRRSNEYSVFKGSIVADRMFHIDDIMQRMY